MNRLLLLLSLLAINTGIAQPGCTDPLAINYSPSATTNDGSCVYQNVTKTPQTVGVLNGALNEISGLAFNLAGDLIAHVDDTDTLLYILNPINGSIIDSIPCSGVNIDWEDISVANYQIFVGDFGNNQSGNRTDLKIYQTTYDPITLLPLQTDIIHFHYGNQTDYSNQGGNQTDFDCEAMIRRGDSLYLFSKQWVNEGTRVYRMAIADDNVTAFPTDSFTIDGLITGATTLENKQLIVLSGYTSSGAPFLELLYDFPEHNLFGGNKRRINLNVPFHQIESIATEDGLQYFLANERVAQGPVSIPPKLMSLDLSAELKDYLYPTIGLAENERMNLVLGDPFKNEVYLNTSIETTLKIVDVNGQVLYVTDLKVGENRIPLPEGSGLFFLQTPLRTFHIGMY
ncbi:MAG: T9SS C-terminal target domain-containing protein [Crocinitomicaceae bacterium]|jgi:hypothetical protein|nr:T9SS C-terminal target domain-containing protein [Crocinitomicaceae bacterium]